VKEFKNKVAVVTGAAGGIGLALAKAAASQGMKVVLADIEEKNLMANADSLNNNGGQAIAHVTDVSDGAQVQALADRALSEFGSVDLVFNNAGVLVDGKCWERTVEDWEWIIGVNLWGVIHGVRTFIPIMLEQGTPCHMVNTSSQAGLTVGPYLAPYNVTKQGVVALTETLHHELAEQNANVKTSVLCPGSVATGIWQSQRNRPQDLDQTVPLGEAAQDYRSVVEAGVAAGDSPEQAASFIFDCVQEERFWIFPQPGMLPTFETRAQSILSQQNPVYKGISKAVRDLAASGNQ